MSNIQVKPKRSKDRKLTGRNVYEEAKDRIRYLHTFSDQVTVSFSGGKDSTAVLLCAIEVAKELDKLPVVAHFMDEEVIHPPTVEYVERIAKLPEVDLKWWVLPFKHRNACSNSQPWWHCWHPEEKDKWVRPMPEIGISEDPRFVFGMTVQDWGKLVDSGGNVCQILGIRAEESMRRQRMVTWKQNDNYIFGASGEKRAFPIYDWKASDVWKLIEIKKADYNKTYDVMNKTGMYNRLLAQRVCAPYGEEPIRNLWMYKECWPELYDKMIERVSGVATAVRYSNTELYSQGYKPEGMTYREHVENVINTFSGKDKAEVVKTLNIAISRHENDTRDPIPEEDSHPLTGLSWRFLARMVTRGDFKGRQLQMLANERHKALEKAGITMEEAVRRHGRTNRRERATR